MEKLSPIQELYQEIEKQQLWCKTLVLPRNGYLKTGGTLDTNLYYVVSGSLKIFVQDEGTENIIRFGYPQDFIAALDSFIAEKQSPLFIQTIKKTTLSVIEKKVFIDFIQQCDKHKKLWDAIQQSLLLQQIEREIDLLTSSPKDRYERVYLRSPQLFQEIPARYIASYLRMSPETLSRLKKT
ncbi:MAG: cyclic nucleotide-binding domain-containing protein [Saprospiraceae bacterium]